MKLKIFSAAAHLKGIAQAVEIVAKWPKWKRELTLLERTKAVDNAR